jgi:hypothetical protein
LSSVEAIHNFDMAAFYENWVQGLRDDERNGEIPGFFQKNAKIY